MCNPLFLPADTETKDFWESFWAWNICYRAEIKGTEQIVVDPFDPRKHITVGQLQSQQQNGSSGEEKIKLYLGRIWKCICVFEQIVFVYLNM